MQQGPLSNSKKLSLLLNNVQQGKIDLRVFKDLQEKICFIRILSVKAGIPLDKKQIQYMLEQQGATVDAIMALQDVPSAIAAKLRLTIETLLVIATVYSSRFGAGLLANAGCKAILHYLFDTQLGIFKDVVELALTITEMAFYYKPSHLSTTIINQFESEYGPLIHAAIPIAMILYLKHTEILKTIHDSKLMETACDFTDLMYGMADDETYEKYEGSLATMPIEEVASSIVGGIGSALCWLWSKTPSIYYVSSTPTITLSEPPHDDETTISPVAKFA
ncbi:hypothetical protein [Candidatus Berkiella aquae]|uniref:Uncharacterized protein n=1 Tax=Candidatus Berkiella aquae TaxID=295108 RepID=A0A0Q9YIY6_9GAMM|nr:hypothetical protein [Candidatus Berkiella aquae]MCS5710199.1 hypothetical protein [Candidatus Berkiella aquae]